jgi:hypothetical protein
MAGRKATFNTDDAIELLHIGMKQKDIAIKLGVKESTLKMFYKRKASGDLKKIKEQRKRKINGNDELELEHSSFLNQKDLKEIRDEKRWGILPNESIGDDGFVKVNRNSYNYSEVRNKLVFDESRGKSTYAIPKYY